MRICGAFHADRACRPRYHLILIVGPTIQIVAAQVPIADSDPLLCFVATATAPIMPCFRQRGDTEGSSLPS
jgi:hypothetical protein